MLGLLSLTGVGAGLATRLKRFLGSARAVFAAEESQLLKVKGIGRQLVERIQTGVSRASIQQQLQELSALQIATLLVDEPGFPAPMQRLPVPPALLYHRGQAVWEGRPCVGIVGTRSPDARGLRLTEEVTKQLVQAGYVIVSGGALGIDTRAHQTALAVGGKTVLIPGSGFHQPYPAENRSLFAQVVEQGGALLGEFAPQVKPERGHFPRRNRLICGLSEGIVVIQCGRQSGALNTAEQARRLGIPVFAFPGQPQDPLAAGPHHLIRQGATLVESGAEIAALLQNRPVEPQQMSLFDAAQSTTPTPVEFSSVSPDTADWSVSAKQLWDVLSETPQHVDEIADASGLLVPEVMSVLLELELDGHVQAHNGMRFSR